MFFNSITQGIFKMGLVAYLTTFQMCRSEPFIIGYDELVRNKKELEKGDEKLIEAKRILVSEADKVLDKEPFTIVDNNKFSSNSLAHNYHSAAIYWWPNPKTSDGLPYIRRDGKYNGELARKYQDKWELIEICEDIEVLGLAYFFTDREEYVKKARKLIHTFFLAPTTRMNPNMENSQLVMGREDIRGNIIEARFLLRFIDGVQLLRKSSNWEEADQGELEIWMQDFLKWMLYSETGVKESKRINNIGTYYTNIAVVLALFTDNNELAKKIIEERVSILISEQISTDGSMPMELKRQTPEMYISSNLRALNQLVLLAKHLGVSIRNYKNERGGSIEKANEWYYEYEGKQKFEKVGVELMVDSENYIDFLISNE